GQEWQSHGIDKMIYSLLSTAWLQFNTLFTFLSSGECPKNEKFVVKKTACYTHPGSYQGDIGIKIRVPLDSKKWNKIIGNKEIKQFNSKSQVETRLIDI